MDNTAVPARFEILAQPDDTSCGPTCLHAVYRYYGLNVEIGDLIERVTELTEGGTLAVMLGIDALRRGFSATLYTYNLEIFDPTWFADPDQMLERLEAQIQVKRDGKLRAASAAYQEFLQLGGVVRQEDLSSALLRRYLDRGLPILTGLSATYLYNCAREHGTDYDDVRGVPTGHFVVLTDYDEATDQLIVADPLRDNPRFESQYYRVATRRVLNAILLGVVTYDANFLILEPDGGSDVTNSGEP